LTGRVGQREEEEELNAKGSMCFFIQHHL